MEKDGRIKIRGRTSRHTYWAASAVLVLGLAATAMLLWIGLITERQRIGFLHMDAVMDARVNTAIFHLWFEEAISEANTESMQATFPYLDGAMQLSNALLHGGTSEHGLPLPPLNNLTFRELAAKVAFQLARLKEVALRRSEIPAAAGIGSPLDEEFDMVFSEFGETSRDLEILAEESLAADCARARRLLFFILLIWVAVVGASTAGLFHWERNRKRAETALAKAYGEIEQRVAERTSQLSSTNRQLLDQIAERIRAEEQLRRSRGELRSLAAHLESKLEEERTWVAREIHDQLGQTLTSLNMDLLLLERDLSKECVPLRPAITETMNAMSNNIEGGIKLVSEISSELRPGVLDDLGFIAALEWQTERFQKRTEAECHLNLPDEEPPLDRYQSTGLFRIFQEILTNVARHANATKVRISLTNDSVMLMLEVSDNGIGITDSEIADSRALGIIGMRERAASLGADFHIEGVRGQGTKIVISMPLGSGAVRGEGGYA